jgi:hypothetical protein
VLGFFSDTSQEIRENITIKDRKIAKIFFISPPKIIITNLE